MLLLSSQDEDGSVAGAGAGSGAGAGAGSSAYQGTTCQCVPSSSLVLSLLSSTMCSCFRLANYHQNWFQNLRDSN